MTHSQPARHLGNACCGPDMRATFVHVVFATALLAGLVTPRSASADWPRFGRALCTASGRQAGQEITSDGAGGAIVVWQDRRSAPFNVFAQHVLASGDVDAAWPVNGRAVMTNPLAIASEPEGAELPVIVSDGAGGAIVVWPDGRNDATGVDIFAQHVLASGVVDVKWPTNGTPVCEARGRQTDLVIMSDGAGGAIVAWVDGRRGASVNDLDVFAHHILAAGFADPTWPDNGAPVCTEPHAQVSPAIVADGTGGAIVAWNDLRSGNPGGDIFAERLLSVGVVDPAWPANGQGLCTAPGSQTLPRIISDGAAPAGGGSGAIVTWHDARDGTNQIYVLRVLNSGAIALGWPVNGLLISPFGVDEVDAVPVSDGAGGAIVAWGGGRHGFHNIRAQHVLPTGVVDAAWPNGGTVLSNESAEQTFPAIASDAAGGAIVTWMDARNGVDFDVFAQHVLAFGALDPAYPANGLPLCTLPDLQQNPAIVATGAAGAIVTWMDRRDRVEFDIFALQVLTAITTDVPNSTPEFTFASPSPNPASGPVTLRFALPRAANVRLAIYDVAGRRVREIASGEEGIGEHALAWDHRDQAGRAVASGVYFARLEVEGRAITRKLMTMK